MIYFIRDELSGAIKIGYSSHVTRRVQELRGGRAGHLTLLASIPGGKKEERAAHAMFRSIRIRGEWFRPGQPLMDYIEAAQALEYGTAPQIEKWRSMIRETLAERNREAENAARAPRIAALFREIERRTIDDATPQW